MTSPFGHRIRHANSGTINPEGRYVLYWMTAFRRLRWNFSLQHAADHARSLGKPLVILEALRRDYPFASQRLHAFILQGMEERAATLRESEVVYYPYVERALGEGKGLLATLAEDAVLVVADDYPSFFLPRMVSAASKTIDVRLDLVDSNGLIPLGAAPKEFGAAYHFRRFLQKELPAFLGDVPATDPLEAPLPRGEPGLVKVLWDRWPPAPPEVLAAGPQALGSLRLDLTPGPAPAVGTTEAGERLLKRFLSQGLPRYAELRNHPDEQVTSGLSPYLHFGLLSSHQVFSEVASSEGWTPLRLGEKADGARRGWWGMSENAEAFLDQMITWRELGFNMASRRNDHTKYESLPAWARTTLEEHSTDPRPFLYTMDQFKDAQTHDPLWNAAQRQLLRDGVIHNYLRMLWGKMILQWTSHPTEALDFMIELNDRFALDGRDPNSYSGIFWVLGRYDRGWPERPVFGKVRSMSSEATRRKVRLDQYLGEFGGESS